MIGYPLQGVYSCCPALCHTTISALCCTATAALCCTATSALCCTATSCAAWHQQPAATEKLRAGAETGAGGRIRDTHATGTGSIMGAATAGYCVGNLLLDKFTQSWEDPSAVYPANLASPRQILIDASNGASDYGNKFGEPLIAGYTRTFGMRVPDGSRREWIKPIMFRCVCQCKAVKQLIPCLAIFAKSVKQLFHVQVCLPC